MKWIKEMEAKYKIDHTERDPRHHFHLKYPFIQPAVQTPRFYVSPQDHHSRSHPGSSRRLGMLL
jgi:hypothetical protein